MSLKRKHPQAREDHASCQGGLPPSPLCSHPLLPRRTSHTSLTSPVALAPAHLVRPTLPAAETGTGATPAGNAASAPAGQSSPEPPSLDVPDKGQRWPGGRGPWGGGRM